MRDVQVDTLLSCKFQYIVIYCNVYRVDNEVEWRLSRSSSLAITLLSLEV